MPTSDDVSDRALRCDWSATPFDGAYKYNRDWWFNDLSWVEPSLPDVTVRRCEAPSGWRLTVIGPFRTRGPGTKHAIGMSHLVPAGMCVEASLIAPTTEDGTMIGEPPIGLHHVHVISRTSIFEDMHAFGFPLFDRHGARFHYHPLWGDHRHGGQCDAARGGVQCLHRRYPDGYGQLYTEEANIDTELVEADGAPDTFWYEASFRHCQRLEYPGSRPKVDKYLAPYVWGSPFDMRLCVVAGTCPLNFTFLVPRNATSALWYAVEHEADGTMLDFDLHTHEHLVRAFVFEGRPEVAGLNLGEWRLEQPWTPLVLPTSLEVSLQCVEERLRSTVGEFCTYEPTIEEVQGKRWVRRGYPRCRAKDGSRISNGSFALRRGRSTTVLGFFDTRPSAAATDHVEYFQHLSMMGLRSLASGAQPPLGARMGTNLPIWDEEVGTLRDWDMIRGFAVGGLGLTRQHVPAVVGAGLLVGGGVAVAAATVLVTARWLCGLWRRRPASYEKLPKMGEFVAQAA